MIKLGKDVLGLVVVGVIAGVGLLYGLVAPDAGIGSAPTAGSTNVQYERAAYCPPVAVTETGHADSTLAVSSATPKAIGVGISFVKGGSTLRPGRLMLRSVPNKSTAGGVNVVGYGGAPPAASLFHYSRPINGVAATSCAPNTSAQWYVPSATTSLQTSEKLIIYNPFPNDAAVRISFFTTKGEQASANLNNVGVGAESSKVISIDRFAKPADTLGIDVVAVRGRIAVWSSILYAQRAGQQPGATLIPGTPQANTTWYVPGGSVGQTSTEKVALLNPTQREADVTVSLIGNKGPIQVPKLVSLHVAPRSIQSVDLAASLRGEHDHPGGVAVIVRSGNEVPIVVGATTFYSGSPVRGADAVPAVSAPARSLIVQPPSTSGKPDNLVLVDPGSRSASVSVELLETKGAARKVKALGRIRIGPGSRKSIDLTAFTKGSSAAVRVESSVGVLAERTAYSKGVGDVSSIVGTPISVTP